MFTTKRPDHRRVRRRTRLLLEPLDDRLVLSGGALSAAAGAVVHHAVAAQLNQHDQHDHPREVLGQGLPATLPPNVSQALRLLYRKDMEQGGGRALQINGPRVAVIIKVAFPPALNSYLPRLRARGLHLIRTVPADGLAEGTLSVAALPAIAQLAAKVTPDAESSPMAKTGVEPAPPVGGTMT
jgi:hypothetical protein